METYTIELKYRNGVIESIDIKSNNIEWSMEQYQRNREPFTWKITEPTKNNNE